MRTEEQSAGLLFYAVGGGFEFLVPLPAARTRTGDVPQIHFVELKACLLTLVGQEVRYASLEPVAQASGQVVSPFRRFESAQVFQENQGTAGVQGGRHELVTDRMGELLTKAGEFAVHPVPFFPPPALAYAVGGVA